MRRIIYTVAAAAAILAGGVAAAAPAMASTAPHLTGSVALAGPADQYAALSNIAAPGSGSLSYTNFNVADSAASGVWSLPKADTGKTVEIDFGYQGGNYPHHLTVDSIQPTGLGSFTFTGHGSYDPDQSYTWNATGSVSGPALSMHIVYTGTQAGYYLDFTGTINSDGSVTGTSFSDSLGRSLSAGMPINSLFQALSFNAPVSAVSFGLNGPGSAQFSSAIPTGHTYAGTPFTEYVKDGGSPGAGNDTWVQDPAGQSTITGGNLTVH
jgi:hypothetical protein